MPHINLDATMKISEVVYLNFLLILKQYAHNNSTKESERAESKMKLRFFDA